MLKIHGPTYRYQGEVLESPELILVEDHHYSEQEQCYHLKTLLDASKCNNHTIIFDHVVQQDEFLNYTCVYFPQLLARESSEFQGVHPNWTNKTHAFNFMINKPRPHRLILLELIDKLKLNSYRHSLCWNSSPVNSVKVTDFRLGEEIILDKGFKNGNYKNALTYQLLLKDQVFEPSCVSLITEPAFYERETIVTEKTIMAIYGGTVPIWVGGWKIPDYMKKIGFDIFDDIVDHSYQDLPDSTQRCQQAVLRNIHLLKDLTVFDMSRLQYNLNLVQTNPWQTQINNLIKIYPDLRKA